MRFSIAAVLALATSLVQAGDPTPGFLPITKPTQGEEVAAGSTYEIVWEPSTGKYDGTVTIGLLGGDSPSTLDIVDTLAKGVDPSTGSYSWAVSSSLGKKKTYGIKISLDSDPTIFQYGFPFKIVADSSSSGSSSSSSATASASATSSSSASASETATETSSSATESTSASGSSTRTTSAASSTITVPSSTLISSTISSNLSTTAHGTITSLTTVVPTTTKTATSTIATNGVASLAAGSFAMLGGVAMAVLAL